MRKYGKGITLCLVALTIALMTSTALAAVGDKLIIGEDTQTYVGITSAAAIGDTIYIMNYNSMLTYTLGDDAPVEAALELSGQSNLSALLVRGDQLYGLVQQSSRDGQVSASLAPISLVDGVYVLGDALALDWSKMMAQHGQYSYSYDWQIFATLGDQVYALVPDERDGKYKLLCFSMTDGRCEVVADSLGVTSIVPYKAGQMLATGFEGDDPWNGKGCIGTLDLATGAFTKAFDVGVAASGLYGLAYDEATDALCYVANGQLNRVSGLDPATTQVVNNMPVGNDSNGARAGQLLDNGLYLFYGAEMMVLRNVNPEQLPERTLVVQGYREASEGFYAFEKAHPEVLTSLTNSDVIGEDVTNALMNRDDQVDIYTMPTNSDTMKALKERGLLMPIEDEGVKAFMARLYPAVQEKLSIDDQPFAVPISITGQNALTYNTVVMEKLGLTAADVPKTWIELIDFAECWASDYARDFPEITLFLPEEMPSVRRFLLDMILQNYAGYMELNGLDAYDSPVLRETLNRLEQADFSGIETEEAAGYSWDNNSVVFSSWGSLGFTDYGTLANEVKFLPSFAEGEKPVCCMSLVVNFINPYSKNRDIAEAYLKAQLDHMSPSLLITLSPDANEPLRPQYYEQSMREMKKYVEDLKAMRDSVRPEEMQQYEAHLIEAEGYLKNEENYWAASAEDIAAYRDAAEHLVILTTQGFRHNSSDDIRSLFDRYLAKQISTEQFVSSLDQKLRMMAMEGY